MRSAAVVVVALLGALSSSSCKDDDTSGGSQGAGPDAGVQSNDAGDGAPIPAGDVDVSVTVATKPRADVRVVFHDASGAVLSDTKTDATGHTHGAGKQVTVVSPDPSIEDSTLTLLTYSDVEPGDRLVVDIPGPEPEPAPLGVVNVAFQVDPAITSGYDIFVGRCGSASADSSPVAVQVFDACRTASGKTVVYGVARDAPNVPFNVLVGGTNGVPLPKPGEPTSTAISAFQEAAKFTTRITGVAEPFQGGASVTLFSGDAAYHTIASMGVPTGDLGQRDAVVPIYDSYAVHAKHILTRPNVSDPQLHYFERLTRGNATGVDETVQFARADATPPIESYGATMSAPGRPEIHWTTPGPGGHPVRAAYAAISWDGVGGGNRSRWLFVLDPSRNSVVAPALPADLSGGAVIGAPPANAQLIIPEVYLVSSSIADSFAKMRALPMDGQLTRILPSEQSPIGTRAFWSTTAPDP